MEEVLLLLLCFLRGYRALHLVKAHEDPEVQHRDMFKRSWLSAGRRLGPSDPLAHGRLPVSAASPFGIRIEVA